MTAVISEANIYAQKVTWSALAGTGGTVDLPAAMAMASVQINGTFNGATVVLEVNNDGTNWVPLSDKDGNTITATAPAWFEISSAALRVRARVTGGASPSVNVTLVIWE